MHKVKVNMEQQYTCWGANDVSRKRWDKIYQNVLLNIKCDALNTLLYYSSIVPTAADPFGETEQHI